MQLELLVLKITQPGPGHGRSESASFGERFHFLIVFHKGLIQSYIFQLGFVTVTVRAFLGVTCHIVIVTMPYVLEQRKMIRNLSTKSRRSIFGIGLVWVKGDLF